MAGIGRKIGAVFFGAYLSACALPPQKPFDIKDYLLHSGVVKNEKYVPGQIAKGGLLDSDSFIHPKYTFSIQLPDKSEKLHQVTGFDGKPELLDTYLNPGDQVDIYRSQSWEDNEFLAEMTRRGAVGFDTDNSLGDDLFVLKGIAEKAANQP